ncbi:MAG TPA: HAD-IIIC family phosphatase [Blastocatellia bacterium]|nr:HAD-IIIC family phosphatase [Blastocatellia bacterium]
MSIALPSTSKDGQETTARLIKLLVWDLDNTIWQGTLLEGDGVQVRDGVHQTLKALDQRGILHSIASKNDHEQAMAKLKEAGLDEYFLYPQVNWNAKSSSIRSIAGSINIGLDAVAFIDDEAYEREEVKHALPEVMTLAASELATLTQRPEFSPRLVTEDAARRREMYRAAARRKLAEEQFVGPSEEFLATLGLEFTIGTLQAEDLQRAEELTLRTHQLNTTGYVYSPDELNALRQSADHLFLVASLKDHFGDYGKIGLTLVEKGHDLWTIKLFLMSCRVMSFGVGTIMMNHLLQLARAAGVRLQAEFLANQRNRMMLLTFKLAGFRQVKRSGDFIIFKHDLSQPVGADWVKYTTSDWLRVQRHPEWVKVHVAD